MKSRSKKYSDLKPVNPDEQRLWKSIEANILTDQLYKEINRDKLNEAIYNLPVIEPTRDLWESLEIELGVRKGAVRPGRTINLLLKIAAVIVLVFSCFYFFLLPHREKLLTGRKSLQDESIEVFLSRICETHPTKCKESDFIEMQGEILKLEEEKANIENSIFVGSGDAEIKKVNDMINDQIGSLKTQINHYVEL
jgi:hypothetical protein